jgi:hypothetical protein
MPPIPINSFAGIDTSVANPKIGTAQSTYGLVRNRTRGHLELPDGYNIKQGSTNPFTIPVADSYTTNIVAKDIHNFYVAEHEGQSVTVFIGTYTKVSRYNPAVTIPRFGVWIKPYWSGSTWVDSWLELTEIEIVALTSASGTNTLNFTDTGKATDYFKNWIAVFEDYTQAKDVDNYFLITGSTSSSADYFGANASILTAARTTLGEKIILCRSFLNGELPSTITSYIFNYLDEIRMTSGNTVNDVSLMSGYRGKTYSWDAVSSLSTSQDRIVLDVGCLNVWRYSALMDSISAQTDSMSPLKAGNYSFLVALGTDDSQIAAARQGYISTVNNMVAKFSVPSALSRIATDGTYICRFDPVNFGYVSKYSATNYTFLQSLELLPDSSNVHCKDVLILGNNLYALYNDGNSLSQINLSAFTLTKTVTIPQSVLTGLLITDGTYIYNVNATTNTVYINKYDSSLNFIGGKSISVYSTLGMLITGLTISGSNIYAMSARQDAENTWGIIFPTNLSSASSFDLTGKNLSSTLIISSYIYDIAYAGIAESGIFLEKRNIADFSLVSQWNITTSTDGKFVTDGTNLYAYTQQGSMQTLLSNVNIAGQSYAQSLLIYNTTQNMVVNGSFIYGDGFIVQYNSNVFSVSSDGTQRIDFKLLVSAGALPARARYAYIYVSYNGGDYYRLFKIDFTVVSAIGGGTAPTPQTWEASAYYHSVAQHFYHRSTTLSIRQTDMAVIGAEIDVDMGRAYGESGVVRYAAGQMVGVKTYVGNFYDVYSAQSFRNYVLVNCVSGEGAEQIDVFDYTNPINIEYGDGDSIQAVGNSNDYILVLKLRSTVLLSLNGDGSYSREVVSRGVGCCSQASVVSYNDKVYWTDYNGVNKYGSYEGVSLVNPSWIVQWRNYTTAQRAAALSVIDRENEALIVCVGSDIWQLDLGVREYPQEETDPAQWMQLGYLDIPTAIKQNSDGYIDFLVPKTLSAAGNIFTISPSGDRCNSVNFPFIWKSNKIEVLELEKKLEYDALILGFIINYTSTFAFNLSLFLDDASSPILNNKVLPSGTHTVEVHAPLDCRCKSPVIQFSGTTVQSSDAIEIKYIHIYEQLEMTGDVLVR